MIDLKKETAIKLIPLGISETTTFTLFKKGLIDERTAKKFLVREEFNEANPCRGEKGNIKNDLADKYCVSFETVNIYIK